MDSFIAQPRSTPRFVRHGEASKGTAADRRHRRVVMRRPVRFVLPDGEDRKGTIVDMSVRGAGIEAEPAAIVGDDVVLHVGDLGRLKGRVAGLHARGFGVMLNASKEQRIMLADALTIALNNVGSPRQEMRYVKNEEAFIETLDGDFSYCRILDVSSGGAMVATALDAEVGMVVRIGRKKATVARIFDGGLGIAFTSGVNRERV
ncbi:MAG: PilZ domain-containing protein [Pseudomonadota bacterium]